MTIISLDKAYLLKQAGRHATTLLKKARLKVSDVQPWNAGVKREVYRYTRWLICA